ncbi:MAG: hypothetical protein P8P74_16065 [Crocinitomicaceae bacterium]|nr:hypothetical protein [Crocinitomicaceae bacterium]
MVKIFIENRSGVLLLLPVMVVLYAVLNITMGYHVSSPVSGFGFYGELLPENSVLSQIFAPLIILTNALLLNSIFNRNGFMEKNNYLPALLYIVGKSYFHSYYFVNGFGLAETFMILAFLQIFKLDQNSDGRKAVFNAAFFAGIAASFYPILLLFIPFLFVIIWILRPFVFRESALIAVGFLIPLIYAGCYSTLFGIPIKGISFTGFPTEWKFPDLYVIAGGLFLFGLATISSLSQKLGQSSIRLKKLFRVIAWMILFYTLISGLELLILRKLDAPSYIIGWFAFFITYGFGLKQVRQFPAFIFYLLLIFSVGKFFVPLDF